MLAIYIYIYLTVFPRWVNDKVLPQPLCCHAGVFWNSHTPSTQVSVRMRRLPLGSRALAPAVGWLFTVQKCTLSLNSYPSCGEHRDENVLPLSPVMPRTFEVPFCLCSIPTFNHSYQHDFQISHTLIWSFQKHSTVRSASARHKKNGARSLCSMILLTQKPFPKEQSP